MVTMNAKNTPLTTSQAVKHQTANLPGRPAVESTDLLPVVMMFKAFSNSKLTGITKLRSLKALHGHWWLQALASGSFHWLAGGERPIFSPTCCEFANVICGLEFGRTLQMGPLSR
jgi:hypothetical protein